MIEILILSVSGATLGIFMLLQILLLRRIDPFERVTFMVRLAFLIGLFPGLSLIGMYMLGVITLVTLLYIFVLSELLYGLCVVLFLLTFFSNVESSITIKLLSVIAQQGKKGITREEIRKKYNREMIVKRRLDRFVSRGELNLHNYEYVRKKTLSVFVLRDYLVVLTHYLFPQ